MTISETSEPYTSEYRVDRLINHEKTAEETTSAKAETKLLTKTGSLGVPLGAASSSTAQINKRKRAKIST